MIRVFKIATKLFVATAFTLELGCGSGTAASESTLAVSENYLNLGEYCNGDSAACKSNCCTCCSGESGFGPSTCSESKWYNTCMGRRR